jgi:hypothetical protein
LGKVNPLNAQLSLTVMVRLPTVLFSLCLLTGTTLFARLVGVPRAAALGWGVLATAITAAGLSAFVPLPANALPSAPLHLIFAFSVFNMIMTTSIAALVYRARANAGPLYVPSLAWMFAGMGLIALGIAGYTPAQIFLPIDNWYVTYGLVAIFMALGGLAFMKSALEFNRIAYMNDIPDMTELSFFGTPRREAQSESHSAIDVVVYLAGFASNPTHLSPVMKDLRFLTSELNSPTQELTPSQQKLLAKIYNDVLEFLVKQEEIRKYSTTELKQKVNARFKSKVKDVVFWGAITSA